MSLCADPGRGLVWGFGGTTSNSSFGDLWSFDGSTWAPAALTGGPGTRFGQAMVFDVLRSRVVLFGGVTSTSIANDTWEWDGVQWQQIATALAPSPRGTAGAAFDLVRGRTVLFGGFGAGVVPLGDTWEWDGAAWQQVAVVGPSARRLPRMSFLPTANHTVLFGGINAASAALGDTWVWSNQTWSQRVVVPSPPAQTGTMDTDLSHARVVWFRPSLPEVWSWNGFTWTRRLPFPSLPAHNARTLAWSPANGTMIAFGGSTGPVNGETVYDDTWSLSVPAPQIDSIGAGCPGASGLPNLAAVGDAGWVNQNTVLQCDNLPASSWCVACLGTATSWGGAPLPIPLDGLGMIGCQQHVAPEELRFLPTNQGTAQLTIFLPDLPGFVGLTGRVQCAIGDPSAPGGIILSNALQLQLARL